MSGPVSKRVMQQLGGFLLALFAAAVIPGSRLDFGMSRQLGHRRYVRPTFQQLANKRAPEVIAAEIMEDLRAALAQFAEIAGDLGSDE